ncbi:hypothetical protein SVIOM74S_00293 [Streptomyces violarus]
MRLVGEDTFAAFGLPGTPGTDEFWAAARAPASTPDGDGWTTLFLWRGADAASIEFESWSEPVPLRRFGDTDCWYAEVRMPARLRVTYQFRVGEEAYADPFNPIGAGGDRSIAATPDAPAQPHWPAVGADGVLPLPRTRIRWASERLGGRRTVRVHPAGGGGPVVLLLDGDDWLYLHPAMTAFDSAVASGEMPPVTLVFLPAKDREAEFACGAALWEAVRDELLPLVVESGVSAELDRLVVAGQSLGGLSALYAALEFPDLVSRVACQSPVVLVDARCPGPGGPLGRPGRRSDRRAPAGAPRPVRSAGRVRRGGTRDADAAPLRAGRDPGRTGRCDGSGFAVGVGPRPGGVAAGPAQGCRLGPRSPRLTR